MKSKGWKLLGWGLFLGFAWLLKPYGPANLPSDEAMLANFTAHRTEFEQFIEMWPADDAAMRISKLYTWQADPPRTISQSRIREYRQLLAQIGVPTVIGSAERLEFQMQGWLRPFSPMKSYFYTTTTPDTLTLDDTETYIFAPNQYQRVCRPIKTNWYICIDYED